MAQEPSCLKSLLTVDFRLIALIPLLPCSGCKLRSMFCRCVWLVAGTPFIISNSPCAAIQDTPLHHRHPLSFVRSLRVKHVQPHPGKVITNLVFDHYSSDSLSSNRFSLYCFILVIFDVFPLCFSHVSPIFLLIAPEFPHSSFLSLMFLPRLTHH